MTRETAIYRNRRGRICCTECGVTVDLCTCPEPDETAHVRLTSEEGQFLAAVFADSLNAQLIDHLYERIVSEFGMLGMMLIIKDGSIPEEDIKRKIVKIGAALTQLATKGTPEYSYPA